MASLATPAELATHLRTATEAESLAGNPDVLDTAVATLLLDNVSAEIRDTCGWSITQETVTAERVYPDRFSGYLFLSTQRLTAFTVTVNGVALVDGTGYSWQVNGGGIVQLLRPLAATDVVLATYTHGYATVPHTVRSVCLDHAAIRYPNPSRYLSETIEGVVSVYARGDLDKDPRLSKYRPPGIA